MDHASESGRHIGAACRRVCGQERARPFRDGFVFVPQQTLTVHWRKLAGGNGPIFNCVEQAANPFVTGGQGAEDGIAQGRRVARPAREQ